MQFLFDEMLKRLVSWCRIFGIYSEFLVGKTDEELLEHAKKNRLVFVTRDVPLSKRCKKQRIKCILIKSNRIEEQLEQLITESMVNISFPEKTRCASCNGELDIVSKESLKDLLPEKVRGEKFWQCRDCGKVFWEGSHWKNIRKVFDRLKEKPFKAN